MLQFSCWTLCAFAMKRLYYEEPTLREAISWFGATPKFYSSLAEPSQSHVGEHYIQLTYASLEDVKKVEMYIDGKGATTGVLFIYLDGSSETVGRDYSHSSRISKVGMY